MNPASPLSHRQIFQAWWPLAISWALMAVELPVLSAVIARLADPEVHLAALGGVVFPVALVVESPIIMLLVASTALSKEWDSYLRLRRFMMWAGAALTGVRMLVVFTHLYFVLVETLIQVPKAVVGPARIGLIVMLPWSCFLHRRFCGWESGTPAHGSPHWPDGLHRRRGLPGSLALGSESQV